MTKYSYIVLIFATNLLLSAHIIPHHHHYGAPHFVLFETQAHDKADNCCCNHGEGQTCLFEQDIDAIYKHSDENCFCASCLLHHPEMFLQATVYLSFVTDFSWVRETGPFLPPPYLISYYCDYASSVLGLRAPPIALSQGEFSAVVA